MTRLAAPSPGQLTALGPARRISEADFQRMLVGYERGRPRGIATILGWKHVHFRPAQTKFGWRTPGTGELAIWPDLTLVRERDRRLIFAELKRDGEEPTAEQQATLEVLRSLETSGHLTLVGGPGGTEHIRDLVRIEVHVWRPADWDRVVEILR